MKQHSTAQLLGEIKTMGTQCLDGSLFTKHPSPQANATNTGCRSLYENRDQLLLINAKFEVLITAEDTGLQLCYTFSMGT
jgi:hypothetical protein